MAVCWEKWHLIGVYHGRQGATHGAFFTPDPHTHRLMAPIVPPIGRLRVPDTLVNVIPDEHPLFLTGLIHDPIPRDNPLLTGIDQLRADAIGTRLCHGLQ